MRNYLGLLLLVLITTACHKKKSDPGADNGCIHQQWISQSTYDITVEEYNAAVAVFQQNNLQYDNLRWYYFHKDSVLKNGIKDHELFTMGMQYVNGLRILNERVVHCFRNGVFYQLNGDAITSTSLDTTAVLTLPQVRKLFVDKLMSTSSSVNLKQYKDACMKAEFGYFNLNNSPGSPPVNLTKAWLIFPEANDRVLAFIGDNGTVLAFTDGAIPSCFP